MRKRNKPNLRHVRDTPGACPTRVQGEDPADMKHTSLVVMPMGIHFPFAGGEVGHFGHPRRAKGSAADVSSVRFDHCEKGFAHTVYNSGGGGC